MQKEGVGGGSVEMHVLLTFRMTDHFQLLVPIYLFLNLQNLFQTVSLGHGFSIVFVCIFVKKAVFF
jgi:hypothetical protein